MNIIRKEAAGFAGPACIDMFGEEPFEPVAKETVAKLSESQEEMILQYDSRQSQMVNRYIKGERAQLYDHCLSGAGDRREV